MNFRPLHDRVLVRRVEAEEKTAGGIIIPDTAKEKPQEGEVVSVGTGTRGEDGTVTPSLVMRGLPKLLSRTTLRPLGPRVTFTASARMSTPRRMRSRASRLNFTSLAAIWLPFQL